ncbi:hypothetical protein SteCoe_27012 [Stentor coeruleus]|uniref:Uncharacterized protein n=1 Tax=Stentor coeruleus TaxID=5963 RepID=A0A1R2BBS7_9CILI|nr:hypothetical protein SteCoe_27012 [Stentor coeruleus]
MENPQVRKSLYLWSGVCLGFLLFLIIIYNSNSENYWEPLTEKVTSVSDRFVSHLEDLKTLHSIHKELYSLTSFLGSAVNCSLPVADFNLFLAKTDIKIAVFKYAGNF